MAGLWPFRQASRCPAIIIGILDAEMLAITRRDPPLLPVAMARAFADFVQREWPFESARQRTRFGSSS